MVDAISWDLQPQGPSSEPDTFPVMQPFELSVMNHATQKAFNDIHLDDHYSTQHEQIPVPASC